MAPKRWLRLTSVVAVVIVILILLPRTGQHESWKLDLQNYPNHAVANHWDEPTEPRLFVAEHFSVQRSDEAKLKFIRKMAAHAWKGYADYAWEYDDLKPVSQGGHNWYAGQTLLNTPVDSLDTLYLMGLMREYEAAKKLVLDKLNINSLVTPISVFETNIRVIGGLLGAYELDGDKRLLDKCIELADKMLPAFETENGFPLNFLNVSSGVAYDPNGGFRSVLLAAIGSLQLEFQYLSDVTGDPRYQIAALFVYDQMDAMETFVPGVFGDWLSTDSLKAESRSAQIGGGADSYYEYLLKTWWSTKDKKFLKMYLKAANSIIKYMVAPSNEEGQIFIPVTDFSKDMTTGAINSAHRSEFQHLACFAGGMFALAGAALKGSNEIWKQHFEVGRNLTESCWKTYEKSKTGLGPEIVNGFTLASSTAAGYKLRPEVVESLFYMWRFTHDPIYRERGWAIAKAIEENCKAKAGYHGLLDVNNIHEGSWDKQESFFIAETLKYLYLLFSDDDTVPLEKYVFNTEAHALSVRYHGKRVKVSSFVPIPTSYKRPIGVLQALSSDVTLRRKKQTEESAGTPVFEGVEAHGG